LLTELVSRGIDEAALLELVREGKYDQLFESISQAGMIDILGHSFRPMADLYSRKQVPRLSVALALSSLLPGCAVPDESDVVDLVMDSGLRSSALTYLNRCAKAPRTVDALEAINLPVGVPSEQKALAIGAIQDRLKK
jgi:hypothetical protein